MLCLCITCHQNCLRSLSRPTPHVALDSTLICLFIFNICMYSAFILIHVTTLKTFKDSKYNFKSLFSTSVFCFAKLSQLLISLTLMVLQGITLLLQFLQRKSKKVVIFKRKIKDKEVIFCCLDDVGIYLVGGDQMDRYAYLVICTN